MRDKPTIDLKEHAQYIEKKIDKRFKGVEKELSSYLRELDAMLEADDPLYGYSDDDRFEITERLIAMDLRK